jgi:hypothetical protein
MATKNELVERNQRRSPYLHLGESCVAGQPGKCKVMIYVLGGRKECPLKATMDACGQGPVSACNANSVVL